LDDLAGVVLSLSDELSGDQGDEFCGRHLRHGDLPHSGWRSGSIEGMRLV
jgi:hypothetical protein